MFGATVSKCRPCSSETLGKVKKGVALTPRPLPLGIPALGDVGAWRQCWDSCHRPCSSTCWPGPASWKLPTVCQQPGQRVPKDYPGSVFPDSQEGHSPARDSQLQSSLALFRQTQLLTRHLLTVPEPGEVVGTKARQGKHSAPPATLVWWLICILQTSPHILQTFFAYLKAVWWFAAMMKGLKRWLSS